MPPITIDNGKDIVIPRTLALRLLSVVIKVLIALVSIGFVYHEIFYRKDVVELQAVLAKILNEPGDIVVLGVVVSLMFVNWGLESVKWKFLINKIETISFFRSLKAIFSGTSVSVFTPNRIGDFGARVFYLDNSDRIKAIFITIVGSISQLVITILLGIIAMGSYMIFIYQGVIDPVLGYVLFGVLSLVALLTLISYFNVSAITSWGKNAFRLGGLFKNEKIVKRLKEYIGVFSLYTMRELSLTLFYSLLRYIVFSLQFYLLLLIFDVQIPPMEAFALIALTFFTMAVIPTVALTEIGVRGSVALFFLGFLSANSVGIVTATFTLWIINLALPALIGSIFVFSANIFRADKK